MVLDFFRFVLLLHGSMSFSQMHVSRTSVSRPRQFPECINPDFYQLNSTLEACIPGPRPRGLRNTAVFGEHAPKFGKSTFGIVVLGKHVFRKHVFEKKT